MGENLNYIDNFISENLKDHKELPNTNWDSFISKVSNIKPKSQLANLFTFKNITISFIFLSLISIFILILGNQSNNNQETIQSIKKINVEQQIKNTNSESKELHLNNDRILKESKPKDVFIKKEIIIKDTLFIRDTVIIEN